jgi:hypothetical protein
MRPAESIPGIGEGRIKENDEGVNSSNFGKCHNVLMYIIYNNK